MKTLKTVMLSLAAALLILPFQIQAQEDQRPEFVIMTRTHWNMDYEDGTREEWMALEKEYFEKVTMKNELIAGTAVLTHFYTADNSELIRVSTYMNWGDIENAQSRTGELVEAGWPDEAARDAFFEKRTAYTLNIHSDEIYRTVPGAKFPAVESDDSKVIYMQKKHFEMPDEGSVEDLQALNKEYVDNIIRPNDLILAYFPLRHGWGSDNREVLDIFVYDSLTDLAASADKEQELSEAHWPEEAKRDEFYNQLDGYFTGWHGDFIYTSIPALAK